MLPTLRPTTSLASTLRREAERTNRLDLFSLAQLVSWAARHYATGTHRFPQVADYDASLSIAYSIAESPSRYGL